MSAPPIWKRDGFHIHVQERDYGTGEFYWRRANDGDLSVILGAAIAAEREACASKAREFAGHYPEGSDGRNTFILLAEWIDRRATPTET